MAAPGRILLVGDSAVGKRQLLAAIGAGGGEPSGAGSAAAGHLLHLDTKYYTADACIELRNIEQCGDLQLSAGGYEAMLLVFDANRQASFDAARAWFEGAGGGEADLPIRLAVVTGLHRLPRGPDGQPARPAWLGEAEQWCAEQLVEFVEAADEAGGEAAGRAAAALAGATGDAGGEGATGLARLREALQAHMWPGMQLKPAPRHGAAALAAAAAAAADEAEAAALESLRQRQQQAGQPNGAATVEGAVPAAASNGVRAGGSAAAAAAHDFSFSRYLQAPEGAGGVAAAGAAVAGEEGEVEQMEQLFAQVAGHRERLAQLPDAQRREAAAALVMQLMAAMGLEEGLDEEEGGEEGGDEEGQEPGAAA